MSKNSSPIGGYYPTTSNTSSSSSGTSSGTATQSPNPYAAYTYGLGLQNALGIAATPYQPYEGQMVAGFTPSQIAAQTGFQNAVGMSTPYYTAAQDLYNQGLNYQANSMLPTASNYYWQGAESAYNPMTPLSQQYFSQAIGAASPSNYNVQPYMNPYQQSVVDATMRQLEQTEKQALGQNTQQSVLRGSYGGSGQFLGRAEVARQQALSNAQTLAQLNANNYLNAQNQYNEQQKNQMQAYQAAGQQLGNLGYQNAALKTQALQNAAQGLGALGNSQQAQAIGNIQNLAAGLSGLGTASQQSYLQSLAALAQSGAQQQQLQQQQLANAYQQFLQAKAYPYQQASYLSGLASGLGPLLGATTTQNSSSSSTGTGSQIGMQPYQNQSGGGGLFGGLTSLLGLGMKAFMPGIKDGGRVTGRTAYAHGGSAEGGSEDEDFASEVSQSSPYATSRASGMSDLGSLIGHQPYASRGGNYATDALKLTKVIPPAKQVAQERLLSAISEALTGTVDPHKAYSEFSRQQSLAPVSHEITSSFFGAQEPSRSGLGGLGESRKSSRREEPEEDTETTSKEEKGGFGSLLSGVKDNLSSLFSTEEGSSFADGGRVYRAEGGDAAAPQGLSPQEAQEYVSNLYKTQLGRQGEQAGMDYWTNQLQKGLNTKEGVAGLFASSPERQILPQTAANYIKDLYQTQLGRQGDQAGFEYWTNQNQRGLDTREDIAKRFADSPEGKSQIENLYRTIMHREPDAAGVAGWQNKLGSGMSLADITKSFNAAPEAASAQNAQNQITTMFQGALGRDPNTAEIKQWTEKLNAGTPLSDLSKQLSSTPGAQNRLADIYQQNLGQGPDVPSRDKWTALMAQGTPLNSIEDAIKSSPEAREYIRTHPGIVGDPARRSPKTVDALMETPESIAFNKKMNPTGRSGAGFEALMAQAYADSPGPQYSPVQQGLQGMPDQSYYTKPLPNYLQQSALASYPGTVTGADGKPVQAPLGYLAISKTAADQDPTAFVKNIYGQYTGAGPTEDQLTKAVDAIKAGTSRESIETDLAKTTPAQNQAFVTQLYNKTFGRSPDAAGLKYWTDQLAKGMPASSVAAYFAKSPEQQSTSVVQGYMPKIMDSRINPYTGLANLTYVAPYKSQPVPFAPGYKDGGRVGRARGGSLSSRERIELAAKAALQAGASPRQAAMLAAISVPESGGNPYAHNPNARTGDNSYGLWQVNMLGGMGPERRKQFGLSRNEELFDPLTNARAALKIANGPGGLNNWTTYKHGKHLPYYSAAVDVVNNLVKDPSAVMAKIEAPAPLSLPTRGGEPSGSSIMYSAPRSQGTGLAEGSNPAQEKKGLRLSELIEDIIQPSLTQEGGSEQPKLATATPAPIIPLAEPMRIGMPLGNLGEENRGRYLDTVIAMNQRARGGRLHFANGGTDDESRDRFYREQLAGSAPQYDEAAGNEALDKYGNLGLDAGLGIMALSGIGAPLAAGLSTLKNAYRLGRRFEKNGEPGFGGLIESRPQAPRGRQPSASGPTINQGFDVPRGMNKYEANQYYFTHGVPGDEVYRRSNYGGELPFFAQPPRGRQPSPGGEPIEMGAPYWVGNVPKGMNKFKSNTYATTYGARPGRGGEDIYRMSNYGFEPNVPPGSRSNFGTVAPRGSTSPVPQRGGLPTFAQGARGGNGESPVYADYRDVTGNVLGGPKSGGPLAAQERFRGPNNKIAKTAAAITGGPTIPPTMGDLPPFNPNITSSMATPKLTEYYKINPAVVAQDLPHAKRARPPRKAAPKSVDNRRYWGDWRDTAGFNEDPIGNFLDNLTGDRKVARKPGTINSPMSPYAGDRFAYGGRAYRGEGGLLGGLGDALSTGISNLRSSKRSPISEGLITAGLGMMASPQHNPLRAIGEGGLLGIQAYNTASEQEREEQKKLQEQKSNEDFARKIPSILDLFTDQRSNKSSDLFPNPSASPIVRRRGGTVFRPKYATGGQPQQDEGFDPFEAIGAVGDTIGSGLQSLGDTIGNALMPSAQAQESEPAQARAPRRSSRSPVAGGLITAGLGMMASPAHNPLRAIGEGGLRGVQAYNTAAEEQRKEDKLEEERQQNEDFAKSLTPKAPAPAVQKTAATEEQPNVVKTAATTKPVVAQDQGNVQVDPMAESLRRLEILTTSPELRPKNATQRDILRQAIEAEKIKIGLLKYRQSEQEKAAEKSPGHLGSVEFAKKEAEARAKELAELRKANPDAKIEDIDKVISGIEKGEIYHSPLMYEIARKQRQIGQDTGLSDGENEALDNTDLLASLSTADLLQQIGGSLGAQISDSDRKLIEKAAAAVGSGDAFNLRRLKVLRSMLVRAKQRKKLAQDYMDEHGGVLDSGYSSYEAERLDKGPLFDDQTYKDFKVKPEGSSQKSSTGTTARPVGRGTQNGVPLVRYSDGSIRNAETNELLQGPTGQ